MWSKITDQQMKKQLALPLVPLTDKYLAVAKPGWHFEQEPLAHKPTLRRFKPLPGRAEQPPAKIQSNKPSFRSENFISNRRSSVETIEITPNGSARVPVKLS